MPWWALFILCVLALFVLEAQLSNYWKWKAMKLARRNDDD